jgi:hypothetical protein
MKYSTIRGAKITYHHFGMNIDHKPPSLLSPDVISVRFWVLLYVESEVILKSEYIQK